MAFLNKVNKLYVLAVGAVLVIAMIAAFMMMAYKPKTEQLAQKQKTRMEKYEAAQGMPQQLVALAKAQAGFELNKAFFNAVLTKQPKISLDRIQGMYDLWREFGVNFGPAVFGFMRSRGYETSGINVPAPSVSLFNPVPYLTVGASGFTLKAKSFPEVLRFMRDLQQCPRMAMITGNVHISGESPNLTATFPLTFYIFTEAARPKTGAAGAPTGPAAPAPGAPGKPGALRLRL